MKRKTTMPERVYGLLEARREVDAYLWTYYRVHLRDVEPIATPGYFQARTLCGGREGGCPQPIHCLPFCNEGSRHMYICRLPGDRDAQWRFLRPCGYWRVLRDSFLRGAYLMTATGGKDHG